MDAVTLGETAEGTLAALDHAPVAGYGYAPVERISAIAMEIDAFNASPDRPFDDFYGRKVFHRARKPILATDCDYEIVSVSGVQGRRLP